jgi:hypothetical protein
MCARLQGLWLLVTRPGAWSARHYARNSRLHFAALRRERR